MKIEVRQSRVSRELSEFFQRLGLSPDESANAALSFALTILFAPEGGREITEDEVVKVCAKIQGIIDSLVSPILKQVMGNLGQEKN